MKKQLHTVNLVWFLIQLLTCLFLIGFYTLPFFGLFQTLLMLYFSPKYSELTTQERSIFQSYWSGYILYFLLFFLSFQIDLSGYDLLIAVFFILFTVALAIQCVRFTHFVTRDKMATYEKA